MKYHVNRTIYQNVFCGFKVSYCVNDHNHLYSRHNEHVHFCSVGNVISKETLTWKEAMDYCTNMSARPVSSDMASYDQINSSILVWTSDRIHIRKNCCK